MLSSVCHTIHRYIKYSHLRVSFEQMDSAEGSRIALVYARGFVSWTAVAMRGSFSGYILICFIYTQTCVSISGSPCLGVNQTLGRK